MFPCEDSIIAVDILSAIVQVRKVIYINLILGMITHQETLHLNTVTLIDSQVNRNKDSNRRRKSKITVVL